MTRSKSLTPWGPAGRRNAALLAVVAAALTGCHWDMWDQHRFEPLEANPFFENGMASRDFPEGTVPYRYAYAGSRLYEFAALDSHFDQGVVNGQFAKTLPFDKVAQDIMKLTDEEYLTVSVEEARRAVIERGRNRFNITCAQCHGALGNGLGMIVKRGFPRPPSYHVDRLRGVEDGYIFDVITNGFGRMYSYAARVKPADRWAIIAYIRTLQLSQHAVFGELSESDRENVLHPPVQEDDSHGSHNADH